MLVSRVPTTGAAAAAADSYLLPPPLIYLLRRRVPPRFVAINERLHYFYSSVWRRLLLIDRARAT